MMQQHYVTFASPGTFVPETTRQEIGSWDVAEAVKRAKEITERHGARPYGFYFSTRSRGPNDLDAKETAKSPFYFVGCRVLTYHDIVARNDPKDQILISNMRCNNITRIAEPINGWKASLPIGDKDIVL